MPCRVVLGLPACVRACLVLLRCYALGPVVAPRTESTGVVLGLSLAVLRSWSALSLAARGLVLALWCLRRLPLAVIGATRLLAPLVLQESRRWAVGLGRVAATANARRHSSTGPEHACLEPGPLDILTFGAGIHFARLWQKCPAEGLSLPHRWPGSVHRSSDPASQQRATGHG